MSFWDVFDNNMVLQRAPAAAAVYGIVPSTATAVSVTITESGSATSYTVQAKVGVDAVHQPEGPGFEGVGSGVPIGSPYVAWKALLKPTVAGGNYTLFAECTGCAVSGEYSNATITNVTFGDVWHCSGTTILAFRFSLANFNQHLPPPHPSTIVPLFEKLGKWESHVDNGWSITYDMWYSSTRPLLAI
jgi:hypothetical protein